MQERVYAVLFTDSVNDWIRVTFKNKPFATKSRDSQLRCLNY
jgi:hypothetical protein